MKAVAIVLIAGAMVMAMMAFGGLYKKEFSPLGVAVVWAGIINILGLAVMVAVKYL